MRSAWSFTIVPASILAATLLASCGGGDGCGGGSATAPCPIPTYGWARVSGFALTDDGAPVANQQILFICADGVGISDGQTDTEGRFSVSLTYSVSDTLQQPFPPRQPDGSFRLECEGGLVTGGDVFSPMGAFEIPFGPTESDLIESEVELRLPAS